MSWARIIVRCHFVVLSTTTAGPDISFYMLYFRSTVSERVRFTVSYCREGSLLPRSNVIEANVNMGLDDVTTVQGQSLASAKNLVLAFSSLRLLKKSTVAMRCFK